MKNYGKPALTIEQQVAQLQARGLHVEDPEAAKRTLTFINYYRLSGYWHVFKRGDDTFRVEGSFEAALALYDFDRRLRLLLMDMIERIEVAFRCKVSYLIAHRYGVFGHEDPANYIDEQKHAEWVERLHKEAADSKEVFVEHFRKTYMEFPKLPVFVAAEIMPMGSLSWLYNKLMKRPDRAEVSRGQYGLQPETFGSWIHCLQYVRNLCAHHCRVWNRHLSVAPRTGNVILGWVPGEIPQFQRIYAVLCVLRFLSRDYPCSGKWAHSVAELLADTDSRLEMQNAMGIPPRWRDSIHWRGA